MSDQGTMAFRLIDREERRVELSRGDILTYFPINAIPDILYEAMAVALEKGDSALDRLNFLYKSTVMKPSVCTYNPGAPFRINTAIKIVRLTLLDQEIENRIDDLEGHLLALQGKPFNETIEDRIELYTDLLLDDTKIDRLRLGGIEMYGDTTYANIKRDPRATLNFYWYQNNPPVGMGYQLNCLTEIVPPGDLFYRYMRVMRQLFSYKFISLREAEYPCAYKFWVSEAKDKSLTQKPGYVPTSSANS